MNRTDEAVALQRHIATAIREQLAKPALVAAQARRMRTRAPVEWLAVWPLVLAAAASDDALWDALAQVRQVIVLERVPVDPSQRGRARLSTLGVLVVLCCVFWAGLIALIAAVQP